MGKRLAILALLLSAQLLTAYGCAMYDPHELDSALSKSVERVRDLQGKTIDDAIQVLGFPSSQDTIAGKQFIRWMKTGFAGGMPLSCTVTAEIDQKNVIVHAAISGSNGACMQF